MTNEPPEQLGTCEDTCEIIEFILHHVAKSPFIISLLSQAFIFCLSPQGDIHWKRIAARKQDLSIHDIKFLRRLAETTKRDPMQITADATARKLQSAIAYRGANTHRPLKHKSREAAQNA